MSWHQHEFFSGNASETLILSLVEIVETIQKQILPWVGLEQTPGKSKETISRSHRGRDQYTTEYYVNLADL